MALAAKDKLEVQKEFCSDISAARLPFDVAKDDLAAVIAVLDAGVAAMLTDVKKNFPVLKKSSVTDAQVLALIVSVAGKQKEILNGVR